MPGFDPKWLLFGLSQTQIDGVFTVSWRVIIIFHISWACGWLGAFGVGGGFALATDFDRANREVASLKLEILEEQIWDTRVQQCEAINAQQNSTAYGKRLSNLLAEYHSRTKQTYQLLSCSEYR